MVSDCAVVVVAAAAAAAAVVVVVHDNENDDDLGLALLMIAKNNLVPLHTIQVKHFTISFIRDMCAD